MQNRGQSDRTKQARPWSPACDYVLERLVPNAFAAGGLNLSSAIHGARANAKLGSGNNIVVVHANNLQFCFNILFHNHNQLKLD